MEDLPGAMEDWEGWRERESGRSLLAARHDDDDDDDDDNFYREYLKPYNFVQIICIW